MSNMNHGSILTWCLGLNYVTFCEFWTLICLVQFWCLQFVSTAAAFSLSQHSFWNVDGLRNKGRYTLQTTTAATDKWTRREMSRTELQRTFLVSSKTRCSHTATVRRKTNILRTLCNTIQGTSVVAISIVRWSQTACWTSCLQQSLFSTVWKRGFLVW